MIYLKQLAGRLTPTLAVGILVAVLAVLTAFGVTITLEEQAAVVAFGFALAVIVLGGYLSPQALLALVAAGIQVAITFGLPITAAQNESILKLTGLLAAVLVVHVTKNNVSISRKQPAVETPPPAFNVDRAPT